MIFIIPFAGPERVESISGFSKSKLKLKSIQNEMKDLTSWNQIGHKSIVDGSCLVGTESIVDGTQSYLKFDSTTKTGEHNTCVVVCLCVRASERCSFESESHKIRNVRHHADPEP